MKCNDCKYSYTDYYGRIVRYCCYDGHINYTPSLIDEEKPEWCPYKEDFEDIRSK